MCKTCKQSIYCLVDGDGFTEVPIADCTTISNCLNGTCLLGSNPQCETTLSFICRTPGMYPDPYDCKTFHHCVKPNKSSHENGALETFTDRCDGDYGYNALTTFCDVELDNSTCPKDNNIAECKFKGQTDSLPENPSLYYICQYYSDDDYTLYPFIYSCRKGMIYDPYLYLCKEK
ncbi:hypothetical protein RI129_010029 [Pyrocoelia pectoralis]|uniref:Chitin-binding type-2 domain-containing protein n=1 Tax=Pyrocoelia pectoralis TaxID=417401 RepID=A0AAN7ZGG6_9COLE